MNEPAKIRIEAEIDAETYGVLHELAEAAGQSDAAFIADAMHRFAKAEADFLGSLKEAERDIESGNFLTQEQMECWLEDRVAARRDG